MSTRRSKQASRHSSPSLSEQDIPATPSTQLRRSGRRSAANSAAGDPSLPAVNLRTSTAYGTSSTNQPTLMQGPESQEQINNVLVGILEPVLEEEPSPGHSIAQRAEKPAPRVKGRRRPGSEASSVVAPPPIEKSFGHESALFGPAGLEASSLMGESDADIIARHPATNQKMQESAELQDQRSFVTEIAQNTRVEHAPQEPQIAPVEAQPLHFISPVTRFLSGIVSVFVEILSALFFRVTSILAWIRNAVLSTQGTTIVVVIAVAIALFGILPQIDLDRPIRWYGGLDLSHNIGQFVPFSLSHPLSALKNSDIRDLERRLTAAEYDIAHLKTRTNLDGEAIAHLEDILPDTIVCQQDEHGDLQIPNNFWHALRDKIRSDSSHLEERFAKLEAAPASSTGLSKKEVTTIAQKQAMEVFNNNKTNMGKDWERFLYANRGLIMSWAGEESDKNVLASKSDFMTLIAQNWADTKEAIRSEVGSQHKTLDQIRNHISKLEAAAFGKDDIRFLANDVAKNLIFSAQLAPLAEEHIKDSAKRGLRRVNHFSLGTGAVINAELTSSNYVFPSVKGLGWVTKAASWFAYRSVPALNPPETALTKWEEHGDCWCSPLRTGDRKWPELAVITSHNIYPDQVIVEYIPSTASLEPGSAPREMELWVFIADPEIREIVEPISLDYFDGEKHPRGLIQIGAWTYNMEAMDHIQSFPVHLDLTRFGSRAYTNNVMVRVKNNWGGDRVDYSCLYRVRLNGDMVTSKRS